MAAEQRRTLAQIIQNLNEFDGNDLLSVESDFFRLTGLDEELNKDLWDELRTTIQDNPAFDSNNERITEYLSHPNLFQEWWFDASNWRNG